MVLCGSRLVIHPRHRGGDRYGDNAQKGMLELYLYLGQSFYKTLLKGVLFKDRFAFYLNDGYRTLF